jgi:subfamily B ATP-binding cassette protein MsbA
LEEQRVVLERPSFSFTEDFFIDTFYYHLGEILRSTGSVTALYFVCLILVVSVFLSNLFQYLASLIQAHVRIKAVTNLRQALLERITQLDLSYFTDTKRGDIHTRVTADVQQIETTVVSTLKILIREPLLVLGFFIALFKLSYELTIYAILIIPVSGGVISYLIKRLKRRATKTQQSLSNMASILDESILGVRIIRAFNARNHILERFHQNVKRYARHNFRLAVRSNSAGPTSEFLGVLFLSFILILGGQYVLNDSGGLEPAQFIVYLVIFSQVLTPAKAIANAFTNIQRGLASGNRIFEIIDTNPEIQNPEKGIHLSEFKKAIVFNDVDFAYEKDQVLSNINFTINKGEVVALVGPSGSGKTTLAELILRFYDPVSGNIKLDDHDLRQIDLESLRAQIGLVTQESVLFNETVLQNIAFGMKTIDQDKVQRAAIQANAHDFIMKLPLGYDTPIGESGSKLSGGQRQRLSIARALLKDPPILILDEATSSLDYESEKSVQEAIQKLMMNRTTIVIAHRLSTIQQADRIIVIENGRIIQKGTHDELLNDVGLYRKLYYLQTL